MVGTSSGQPEEGAHRRVVEPPPSPICFPRLRCSPYALAKRHQSDVGSLSCRVTFKPVSAHYRTAFASSDLPSPHLQQIPLRFTCPCGRRYGVTTFRFRSLCGVRYLLSTGKHRRPRGGTVKSTSGFRTFWSELVSHFSSPPLTVVAQVHMCLPYPLPSHYPACGCQEDRSLTVPIPHAFTCFCTLSGPLFIQAPRFTRWYGWFRLLIERNNFILEATSCRSNGIGGERRDRAIARYPSARPPGLGAPRHSFTSRQLSGPIQE
jgi:hypothetical protein